MVELAQAPHLFVIRKQQRKEAAAQPVVLAYYYVLDKMVYQVRAQYVHCGNGALVSGVTCDHNTCSCIQAEVLVSTLLLLQARTSISSKAPFRVAKHLPPPPHAAVRLQRCMLLCPHEFADASGAFKRASTGSRCCRQSAEGHDTVRQAQLLHRRGCWCRPSGGIRGMGCSSMFASVCSQVDTVAVVLAEGYSTRSNTCCDPCGCTSLWHVAG